MYHFSFFRTCCWLLRTFRTLGEWGVCQQTHRRIPVSLPVLIPTMHASAHTALQDARLVGVQLSRMMAGGNVELCNRLACCMVRIACWPLVSQVDGSVRRILITGSAHHQDLRFADPTDSPGNEPARQSSAVQSSAVQCSVVQCSAV